MEFLAFSNCSSFSDDMYSVELFNLLLFSCLLCDIYAVLDGRLLPSALIDLKDIDPVAEPPSCAPDMEFFL